MDGNEVKGYTVYGDIYGKERSGHGCVSG